MKIVTLNGIATRYKKVQPNAHKGTQGHTLLIGGSYGKIGSICLSSKAALRSGSGLVTAYIPNCGYNIMQTYLPEAMVITDDHEKHISTISATSDFDAAGIGPGLGTHPETTAAFGDWLAKTDIPMVIDADALNILAQHQEWLAMLRPGTILTPHPKELERLIGKCGTESEKMDRCSALAQKYNLIIVSKGAPTMIITADEVYQNRSGNSALTTAGSGDVLTGILTGLRAQGYNPLDCALVGVFIHGLTADLALPETGVQSFIASDIINYLGKAFLKVHNAVGSN